MERAPVPCGRELTVGRERQHVTACLGPLRLQKLTNVRIMKENMRTGNLPANMKKARVIQIIPCTQPGGAPRAGRGAGGP